MWDGEQYFDMTKYKIKTFLFNICIAAKKGLFSLNKKTFVFF